MAFGKRALEKELERNGNTPGCIFVLVVKRCIWKDMWSQIRATLLLIREAHQLSLSRASRMRSSDPMLPSWQPSQKMKPRLHGDTVIQTKYACDFYWLETASAFT